MKYFSLQNSLLVTPEDPNKDPYLEGFDRLSNQLMKLDPEVKEEFYQKPFQAVLDAVNSLQPSPLNNTSHLSNINDVGPDEPAREIDARYRYLLSGFYENLQKITGKIKEEREDYEDGLTENNNQK